MIERDALVRTGRAWVYGDSVMLDHDMIPRDIAVKYRLPSDAEEISKHLMHGIDPTFATSVKPGDLIVAGQFFGSGSIHVQALFGMNYLRLGVIAESVSRGFYRLAVATGIPFLPACPGIRERVAKGDPISVDFTSGQVTIGKDIHQYEPIPAELQEIIAVGGERAWLTLQLEREQALAS